MISFLALCASLIAFLIAPKAASGGTELVLSPGPGTVGTPVTINCAGGTAFSPGVRGHNIPCGWREQHRSEALALGYNTSLRSLPAGGLDADAYNWKTNIGYVTYIDPPETYRTTLEILRELRGHGVSDLGIWTANMHSAGGAISETWNCFPRKQWEGYTEGSTSYSYTVDPDAGGNNIGINDLKYDDGTSVILPDAGDGIKITFNVLVAGTYPLHVRVRSGSGGDTTNCWRDNSYGFQLDAQPVTFTGDSRTLSPAETDDTIWGSMNSLPVQLSTGNHVLKVTAKSANLRVDYFGLGQEPASLAADWVRYINRIVRTYRIGDTITDATDQRILSEITWSPKLLAAGEAAVPRATYWEIGNEPEASAFPVNHALTPAQYAARYRVIATAMRAEDPTVKVGPCMTRMWDGQPNYLEPIKLQGLPMDFISYHPYYDGIGKSLCEIWQGGNQNQSISTTLDGLQGGLRDLKAFLNARKAEVSGYGTSTYVATEYNPSLSAYTPLTFSMAHALAVTESVLTFAEQGLLAANYWERPSYNPQSYKVWKALQDHLGDRLLKSYADGDIRLYATRNSTNECLVVWAMNFSDSVEKHLNLTFENLPASAGGSYSVTKLVLKSPSGDTSLMTPYSRHQAESVYNGLAGAGSRQIAVADGNYDDGSHVQIPDRDDSVRLKFKVATTGKYRVYVRNRAGWGTAQDQANSRHHWSNKSYQYKLDGVAVDFDGDPATISGPDSDGTFWGVADNPFDLTAGTHTLDVTAQAGDLKLDWIMLNDLPPANWVQSIEHKSAGEMGSYTLTCEDATLTLLIIKPVAM